MQLRKKLKVKTTLKLAKTSQGLRSFSSKMDTQMLTTRTHLSDSLRSDTLRHLYSQNKYSDLAMYPFDTLSLYFKQNILYFRYFRSFKQHFILPSHEIIIDESNWRIFQELQICPFPPGSIYNNELGFMMVCTYHLKNVKFLDRLSELNSCLLKQNFHPHKKN